MSIFGSIWHALTGAASKVVSGVQTGVQGVQTGAGPLTGGAGTVASGISGAASGGEQGGDAIADSAEERSSADSGELASAMRDRKAH